MLGNTDLEVSSIGFGGIPIQRVDEETAINILEECSKRGINFIDTARGYNESEELIGKALEIIGRDKFYIASKSMRRDRTGILEELNTSLENLNIETIDLFQFHNVRTMDELDQIISIGGALEAIKEAKRQGKIREIGISSHSPELLDKAIDLGEFVSIQCPYNPLEQQADELFKKAKAKGIGVIVMKPLAGGAIREASLSLRFILNNPNVTVVIPGMDSLEQVIENTDVAIKLRDLTKGEEERLFKEVKTLGTEFCRRCGYCLPCPQGIDIPTQFLFEGYYSRYNLQEWAQSRYQASKINAADCIECGICEGKCPYDLPIRKMMKNVAGKLG